MEGFGEFWNLSSQALLPSLLGFINLESHPYGDLQE
jgi:hypothetical protein